MGLFFSLKEVCNFIKLYLVYQEKKKKKEEHSTHGNFACNIYNF